jgi:gas vesicle protein
MFGRKENQILKAALFFAAGAAVGAAVALLFAPTTGKKLQKQLKSVVDDQVENFEKVIRKVV